MADLGDHIKKEREFLHDLSNQLVIAFGMGSILEKKLADSIDPTMLEKLGKVNAASKKMSDAIKSRRDHLINMQKQL